MTRAILCVVLSVLALALGLFTALIQSENRERGLALNALKEECGMIEAINGDRAEQILAKDFGPLPRLPIGEKAHAIDRQSQSASKPALAAKLDAPAKHVVLASAVKP